MTPTAKQKVLYVITKSNFGGAQRYVYDLATNLPEERFEPVVAVGGTGEAGAEAGELVELLTKAGVRVVFIAAFMRDVKVGKDIRAFRELVHLIRKERPQVLHLSSSKAGGIGALAGRVCRLISTDNFRRVRQMPFMHNKAVLVRNGLAAPTLHERSVARWTLVPDAPQDHIPWVGAIAEYHQNKNLDLLVKAAFLLRTYGKPVRLVLIGEGEEREHLKRLAAEHDMNEYVHLTGFVPNAAACLKAFDAFSLPSAKEGLPYVLIEAGYAGVPVVASDIPGNREVIEPNVSGVLTEQSVEALANALQELLGSKKKAERYGSKLRASVTSRFSIERMVQETVALYEHD
jgi:glycosyltransferase involved in cell wall biosynthesis